MALIKCPKCGKSISDKAIKCPNCGFSKQEIKNAFKKYEIKAHPISFIPVDDELIKENQSCIFIR